MTLLPTVNGAARLLAGTTRPQDIDSATLGSGRATDPATDAEGLATATALATPITGATLAVPGIARHDGNDASFMLEYDGGATWNNANEVALFHGTELIFYGSGLDSVVYAHPSASVRLAVAVGITLSASALTNAVFGLLRYVIEKIEIDGLTQRDNPSGADFVAFASGGGDTVKTRADNLVAGIVGGAAQVTPADGDKVAIIDVSDGGALKNSAVSAFAASIFPTGIICPFGGRVAPAGWLVCTGAAVSRATYADLFRVIGTSFGPGNGSTTFNIPATGGRVLGGYGGIHPSLGGVVGSAGERLTVAHMPAHTHTHTHAYTDSDLSGGAGGSIGSARRAPGTARRATASGGASAGAATPTAISHMQPTLAVNWIIKT